MAQVCCVLPKCPEHGIGNTNIYSSLKKLMFETLFVDAHIFLILTYIHLYTKINALEFTCRWTYLFHCPYYHYFFSIIKNHDELWVKQCCRLGVNMSKVPGWIEWHKVYITSLRQQASLRNGTAFTERFMQLQNCKKAVKAVDYQDGFLCTGKK